MEQTRSTAKPGIHPLMVFWLFLAVLISFLMAGHEDYGEVLGILAAGFTLLSFIGLIVSATTPGRAGPVIFIIGCVFFVPVGMVGAIGARKALEEYERQKMLEENPSGEINEQNKWDSLMA